MAAVLLVVRRSGEAVRAGDPGRAGRRDGGYPRFFSSAAGRTERPPDEWDALAALNTAPEQAAGYTVSLGLACRQAEAFWGASWYWNPARWGTRDGYVPFPVLWDAWRAMQSVAAWQRMQITQAVALAQPVDESHMGQRDRYVKREQDLAFPAV